jgi:flagellar biosynthesis GTPase FlhF
MRFRRYLAQMLDREDTASVKNKYGKIKTVSNPLPVIGIYFLGRPFEEVDNNCIKLDHDLTDMQTGEKIKAKISFIERLMPKGFFIVFENLHPTLKTSLGRLLSLFVQENFAVVGGREIKYMREYKAPMQDPEILHIISTLQAATGDEKFIKAVEDEEASERFVRMLLEEEREKADEADKRAIEAEKEAKNERKLKKEAEAKVEIERKLKKEAEAKVETERKLKKEAEVKVEEERRQKEEERRQKELAEKKAEAAILVSIQALRSAGLSDEKIAEKLTISLELVKNLR